MTLLQPVSQPARWIVRDNSVPIADGETYVGEATGAGSQIEFIGAEGDNEFLTVVIGKGGNYQPLPALGQPCIEGKIYSYGSDFVICRQPHNRTEHAPADIPALFMVHRVDGTINWIAGEKVDVGTRRMYNGVLYAAIQAHVTQADWTPAAVPALWSLVTPPTAEWAIGVAYKIGDIVTYLGKTYSCRQAHTSIQTWNPVAAASLWLLL